MNRSQSLLARIAACTIALLAADGAAADVTLSVVDATPTAFHDGTLPGIGETIFSADVFVDVTPDERWFSGGLGLAPFPPLASGVELYYSRDPNTGAARLTAPGNGTDAQAFGTFVSLPFGQTQNARFRREAQFNGGYWGAPVPIGDPDWLEISYLEFPPSLTFGSGFTQRVSIDTSRSPYAGWDVYVSSVGPRGLPDVLLAEFESAASVSPSAQLGRIRWGFYAVPEPGAAVLLLLGAILLVAWRKWARGAGNGVPLTVLVVGVWLTSPQSGLAIDLAISPQIRIDQSGRFGAAELAIATSQAIPAELAAAWHDFTEGTRLGIAVSLDAGRTWDGDILPRPTDSVAVACDRLLDPFAFADHRTGRIWLGGFADECTGHADRLVIGLREPGERQLRPLVQIWEEGQSEVAFGAAGPDPADPTSTDPNSVFQYVVHFKGFSRSHGRGLVWADPRAANDITLIGQSGGHALVPGGGGEARVRTGPGGELFIAWTNDDEYRLLVDEDEAGVAFDETEEWNENDPANPDGFSYLIAKPNTKMGQTTQQWIPGTLRMPNFPHLAVGPPVDPNDPDSFTLYFIYHDRNPADDRPDLPNVLDIDTYLTKSTDHGRTWDTPVQILEDPVSGRSDQFLPFIEVTSDGVLHVSFYDTRENPNQPDGGNDGLIDAYYAYSEDDGDTWTVKRLTQSSFSVFDSERFLGDYGALAAVRGPASAPQTIAYPCYVSSQAGDRNVYVHAVTRPDVLPECHPYLIDVGGGKLYSLRRNDLKPALGTDFTWASDTLTLLTAGDWQLFARDNPSDPNSCAEPNMAERADISHLITIDPDIAGYTSLHLIARDIDALTGGGDTLSLDTGEPNDPVGLRLNVRDIYGGVAGNHLRFDDAIGVLGDQGVNTAGTLAPGVVIDVERIGIGTRLEFASLWGDLVCGAAEARGANPSGGGIEAGIAILGVMTGSIRIADDFPGRIEIGGDVDRGQIDIAGDLSGMIDIAGFLDGDIRVDGAVTGAARIATGGQLKLNRVIQVGDPNVALGEIGVDARIDIAKHLVGAIEAGVLRGAITLGKSLGTSGALELDDVRAAGVIEISEHLRGLLDVGGLGAGSDLRGLVVVHGDLYDGGQLLVEDTLNGQIRILGSLLDNGGTPNPNEIDLGALASSGAITIDYDGNHDTTGCEHEWGDSATIQVGMTVYDNTSDPNVLAPLHVYDVSNLPGDCDNNWVLNAADITAFNDSAYAVNYPGLGDPNAPDGSTAFHFDVNCDGVVGDPNDLARLNALIGPNPPADCRSALPDCPE